jgi:CheY-like chemotaxis protein
VLLVADGISDAAKRSASLRERGYEVDAVDSAKSAIVMTRSHSYDLIVIPGDCNSIGVNELGRQLRKLSPNSMIACLADCKKPLPCLEGASLLWKGEPIEYFVARVDALSATA